MPNTTDLLNSTELRFFDQCQNWDNTTFNCNECPTGSYLTNNICCKDGEVALVYGDLKFCQPIAKQQDGCAQYDIVKGTCSSCVTGYNPSFGVCCPDATTPLASKTYIDLTKKTPECTLAPANCHAYDDFAQ